MDRISQIERAHQAWLVAIDAVADPLFVHDEEFRVVRCNRAYARRAGLAYAEIIGRPYYAVFPRLDGPLPTCLKRKAHEDSEHLEEEVTLPSGEVFLSRSFPIEELQDGARCHVHTLTDITERKRSAETLRQSLFTTVQTVSHTLEKRDPYTAGHQHRVSELCVAIARELGLEEDVVDGIRLGSAVHDVGKIYVPAEILNRPGRLTRPEMDLIRTHPQVGYDIMKEAVFPWPIAAMIIQHHERLDGSGYPQGLRGEEIMLEARIIAVADVVESMMSHRPYRPARGVADALAEINQYKSVYYAPEVVEACTRVVESPGAGWMNSGA